jgi:hypothetical protein
MTLALGFGAAAPLDTGPESEVATSNGNLASPLLAEGWAAVRDPREVPSCWR